MNTSPVTYTASGALANTGRVVRLSDYKTVAVATDKSAHFGFGILESTASAAGETVAVTEIGDTWVELGDDVDASDFWGTFDNQGRVIPVSAGTDQVIGYFKLRAAGTTGNRVPFFVLPSRAVA